MKRTLDPIPVTSQIEHDKAQVVLMQTGNFKEKETAFNSLYKRYKKSIAFNVNASIKNKQETNDIVQEVFAKVYEKINTYQPDFAFSTWLFTIARNALIDFKRKDKHDVIPIESIVNMDSDDDSCQSNFQIVDKSIIQDERLISTERKDAVMKALEHGIKANNVKQVMFLIFIKQKSYEDVAIELDLPLGTVKALMFRGKNQMLTYFKLNFPELELIPFSKSWKDIRKKTKRKSLRL